jgi:hypothetical protein
MLQILTLSSKITPFSDQNVRDAVDEHHNALYVCAADAGRVCVCNLTWRCAS